MREVCGTPNTELVSYEVPREGNPFETTVYAWEEGEAKCERRAGHGGPHGFQHGENYLQWEGSQVYLWERK